MNRTVRKYRVSIDSNDRNREEYPESNSYTIELAETLYGIYSIELIDATLHNSNYIVGKYNDKIDLWIDPTGAGTDGTVSPALNWNMIKGSTGTIYTVSVPRADYALVSNSKALNIQSTLKNVLDTATSCTWTISSQLENTWNLPTSLVDAPNYTQNMGNISKFLISMKVDNTFPGHFIIINGIRTNKEIAMPILQLPSKGKTDGGGLNIVHPGGNYTNGIVYVNGGKGNGGFDVRIETLDGKVTRATVYEEAATPATFTYGQTFTLFTNTNNTGNGTAKVSVALRRWIPPSYKNTISSVVGFDPVNNLRSTIDGTNTWALCPLRYNLFGGESILISVGNGGNTYFESVVEKNSKKKIFCKIPINVPPGSILFYSNSNFRAYYNFYKKVLPTLERLEISFYRSYSGSYQLYDFNGVDNSLTFEITCHIDKRWSHETNKNNYYINDDVEYYEQIQVKPTHKCEFGCGFKGSYDEVSEHEARYHK